MIVVRSSAPFNRRNLSLEERLPAKFGALLSRSTHLKLFERAHRLFGLEGCEVHSLDAFVVPLLELVEVHVHLRGLIAAVERSGAVFLTLFNHFVDVLLLEILYEEIYWSDKIKKKLTRGLKPSSSDLSGEMTQKLTSG